jgi:hypothetical protein
MTGSQETSMSVEHDLITRRDAIQRVGALLGTVTFVGGSALLTACERAGDRERTAAAERGTGQFSAEDIAFLDEVADTILPTTQKSPGAKAAKTGAFMALMVTDTYDENDQKVFRDGLRALDGASQKMHNVGFMRATPQQRLTLLEQLDREAKAHMDARQAAQMARARERSPETAKSPEAAKEVASADTGAQKAAARAQAQLPDQRKEGAVAAGENNPAPAITADAPTHYFRMMKELALLGFFTSEIGYTQAMRYRETPGRYDPCVPYTPGEKAWAPHA